ncbi:MAG TPA: bifunctional ornithine acetyltransferase/N-acetylglutamate synthase [Oculatellaceae cyanobacterium]
MNTVIEQSKQNLTVEGGSVTTPKGFSAAGAFVGIKKNSKPDLALIWSNAPANCAAVFTTNMVMAAPLLWNQKAIQSSIEISGIVINSGNANACTGEQGMLDAQSMATTLAEYKGVSPKQVLVASTGVIGVKLPIEKVVQGIGQLAPILESTADAGLDAAAAIMTTDTYAKHASVSFKTKSGTVVTLGAIAKGSGMIHPNMATMLGFITTDCKISGSLLTKALKESNESTYNMISVDGDTSTNDMVAILANGQAGNALIDKEDDDYQVFCQALTLLNGTMAKAIVKDGEGATKFLEVQVSEAQSLVDARKIARAIVSSNLVKAAFFGEDANWGRILCAAGYSGAQFSPEKVSISLESAAGSLNLMTAGEPAILDEELAKTVLAEKEIVIKVNIGNGDWAATAWGCDLSYDYVRINGAYRT